MRLYLARLLAVFCYVMVAVWAFIWLSMNYFGWNKPRQPIPSEGRIYPFQDHYTIVYLTRGEHLLVSPGVGIGILALCAAAGLLLKNLRTNPWGTK
jgi:hypothetical protein